MPRRRRNASPSPPRISSSGTPVGMTSTRARTPYSASRSRIAARRRHHGARRSRLPQVERPRRAAQEPAGQQRHVAVQVVLEVGVHGDHRRRLESPRHAPTHRLGHEGGMNVDQVGGTAIECSGRRVGPPREHQPVLGIERHRVRPHADHVLLVGLATVERHQQLDVVPAPAQLARGATDRRRDAVDPRKVDVRDVEQVHGASTGRAHDRLAPVLKERARRSRRRGRPRRRRRSGSGARGRAATTPPER